MHATAGSLALFVFPFLLLLCFLLYWAGARHAYQTRPVAAAGDPDAYDWHFFVPCRDEETVVGTTVSRLRGDFPAGHVWVIDDDSDDATGAIVTAHAEADPYVHLVQRRRPHARTGKGAALNSAYEALDKFLPTGADRSRVIVCVLDADGRLAPHALTTVSGPAGFGDPQTGGVQVTVRMRNADDRTPLPGHGRLRNALARLLVRVQDMEFTVSNTGMQLLRNRTGSAGLGGNGQFTRLAALDRIATAERRPWQRGALLEDYELGLHMILSGYQVRHIADTWVSQEGLPHLRRLLTQRTRWAQGNLQCVRYAPRVIASRHFRARGVLETLYTFLQPVAHLVSLVVTGVLLGLLLVDEDRAAVLEQTADMWPLPAGLAILSIGPFVLWGPVYRRMRAAGRSRLTGLLWGLALWLYAYHLFPVSARAFVRLLRGRTGWAKTRRNAEPVTAGTAVAIEH